MYRKILLPIDGSSLSHGAVPHAVAIAKAMEAEIVLLRVVETGLSALESAAIATDPATGAASSVTFHAEERHIQERGRAEGELEAVREEIARLEPGLSVSVEVAEGHPGETIVEQTKELGCDLVVMSSHGRSGVRRAVLGSVTDHVVRHTPGAAVLVVVAEES